MEQFSHHLLAYAATASISDAVLPLQNAVYFENRGWLSPMSFNRAVLDRSRHHACRDGRTIQAPTYDYFEVDPPAYAVSGGLALPRFEPSSACTLRTDSQATGLRNASIVSFTWREAASAGCETIAHAAAAVKTYGIAISSAGGAAPALFLLMLTDKPSKGPSGGVDGRYQATRLSIPDGAPAVLTALLPADRTDAVYQFIGSGRIDAISAVASKEKGPWNELFLSPLYRGFTITIIVLNSAFLLCSLWKLVLAVREGGFVLDRRNAIYFAGVASCILSLVYLPMRKLQLLRIILFQVGGLISAMAFYGLLLLWVRILEAVQHGIRVWPFYTISYVTMILQVLGFALMMCSATIGLPARAESLNVILWQLIPMAQLISGGLFFYYAYKFSPGRQQFQASQKTCRALRQLSHIAIAGLFSFLLVAVNNAVTLFFIPNNGMMILAIGYHLQEISRTIRFAALLLLLGVKIPERRTSTDDRKEML
ncbi:hypothetical protein THASP1DRAFT_29330 [Thamnocephalis sphaerospora]|uniref:Uncharacterized protein n=1 Tax=Thamnocephalis sphaerospora TaxID=78915 RepID=A0A4P9XRZ0_9FUNG|nr:hypothetical protein THASP1DRAFT_29330 [Thamnocephalis sphaerospora]|eukprot:RKP08867.1 hypothetical protein THASP1DRAFT_29330 [Thamnocephalis sphaerospora]